MKTSLTKIIGNIKYVFFIKSLTEKHLRTARFRLFYWCVLHQYESELCQRCGGPVRLVFHVPDAIWERITGHARSPGGEAAPGVLCPQCVDVLAEEVGLPFLRWTCTTDDSVMRG